MTDVSPPFVVRRLTSSDLPAALGIQADTYPEPLREDENAFASRLSLPATYSFAATRGGALVAYILAHGWPSAEPPTVGTVLQAKTASEVLFIHDLAVSLAGRGLRIGEYLVACASTAATRDGLKSAELIAVARAAGYWRMLGFAEAAASADLAARVAAYGPDAKWMTRDIASECVDR